jgi:hypothetical protein
MPGTTINTLFKSKRDGGAGGLTPAGQQLLRHEGENSWDPGYNGHLRPNSSFIIGTMRNPFEFYVSFWSMFTLPKMVGTNDCLRRTAIECVSQSLSAFDRQGVACERIAHTHAHTHTHTRTHTHTQLQIDTQQVYLTAFLLFFIGISTALHRIAVHGFLVVSPHEFDVCSQSHFTLACLQRVTLHLVKWKLDFRDLIPMPQPPCAYSHHACPVRRYGRYELFDNRGRHNVKQFQAWMHFLFVESCDPCKLTMWRVFQALYIGAPGACPSYDRMVRLEDFYPTLTQALKDYEVYSPGTVNWDVVREWQAQRKNTIRDGPECPYVMPTLC